MVKVKYHLHVTLRETPVVPSHIVVPWPHAVRMAVQEVIQTPGAVCQLAKAFGQSKGAMMARRIIKTEKYWVYKLIAAFLSQW